MVEHGGLTNEGDRYLVEQIQKGDQAAFQQLVDRYSGRLMAYASKRVSGSGLEAEDVLQETFLGLLQSIEKRPERLSDVRSIEAYLFQILRNKIYDLAARRPEAHGLHRVPLAEQSEDGIVEGYEPIAPGGTPSSHARRDEAVKARRQVLADVLEEYIRRVKEEKDFRSLKILELLFLSSWKNRDIAAAVGTSEPTVTRTKQDAIDRLSRLVGRHRLGGRDFVFPETEESASELIRAVWAENLLSCVKRSTLGAYSLGTIDKAWKDYVAFHVEIVGCDACAANLEDIRSEGRSAPAAARERVLASSVGFLSKLGGR